MAFRLFGLLTASALSLVSTTASAGEPEKTTVTRLFSVVDLVTPIPDFVVDPFCSTANSTGRRNKPTTTAESGERLVKLVTSMVRPYSWNAMGGTGKAEYFDMGSTIVVTNTPDVLTEVADLIEAMRRLQEISISTEIRILKVPVGFCEQFGVKRDEGVGLADNKVRALLDAVQNFAETTVTQFPKVTTFNGQEATVRVGERRMFATGADVVKLKGQTVLVPKNTEVDLGDTLSITGCSSADRKFVNLQVKLTRTTLVGEVELIPITMTIRPLFEGGSQGQPIPFTQFLQAPDLKTQTVEKTIVVPSGGAVILGGWNEPGVKPPSVNKVPYLSRLFKNGGTSACEVIVLATTRVVRTPDVDSAPMPRTVSGDSASQTQPRLAGPIITPTPVPIRVAPSQYRW